MTFLELVQATSDGSGVIASPPVSIAAALAGTKDVRMTVGWVQRAYDDIQRSHARNWLWLRQRFSSPLIATIREYDAESLGITSRFAEWVASNDKGQPTFSLYDPAIGVENEAALDFEPWGLFQYRTRGTPVSGRPATFSVDDAGQVVFDAVPDLAYVLQGTYRKSLQTLALDGDIPEMPTDFHYAIQLIAQMKSVAHDALDDRFRAWAAESGLMLAQLRKLQLPTLTPAEPLA